jgi:hypothetical protein
MFSPITAIVSMPGASPRPVPRLTSVDGPFTSGKGFRTAFRRSTLPSLPASPRVRCMNPQPQPPITLALRHVQSLCVSTGPQCPVSLLSSLGQSSQSVRSRAATAAHCRQQATLYLSRACSTTCKIHRLARRAASFKSLYLKRPSQTTAIEDLS